MFVFEHYVSLFEYLQLKIKKKKPNEKNYKHKHSVNMKWWERNTFKHQFEQQPNNFEYFIERKQQNNELIKLKKQIIQLHILCGMRDLNFLLSLAVLSNSCTIFSIQFSTWSTSLLLHVFISFAVVESLFLCRIFCTKLPCGNNGIVSLLLRLQRKDALNNKMRI